MAKLRIANRTDPKRSGRLIHRYVIEGGYKMPPIIKGLLLITLLLFSGCNFSTESIKPKPVEPVTMTTDSLQYRLYSDRIPVTFRIENRTDSVLIFPACGSISTRVDTMANGAWSLGYPRWLGPCVAIFPFFYALESDSVYRGSLLMDKTGTFRIVTFYWISSHTITDTLYSNHFTIY